MTNTVTNELNNNEQYFYNLTPLRLTYLAAERKRRELNEALTQDEIAKSTLRLAEIASESIAKTEIPGEDQCEAIMYFVDAVGKITDYARTGNSISLAMASRMLSISLDPTVR